MSKGYLYDFNDNMPSIIRNVTENTKEIYKTTLNSEELEKNWEPQGLTWNDWQGILRIECKKTEFDYGFLFYKDKLPSDLVVTFNYMFLSESVHDMNFIYPLEEKRLYTLDEFGKINSYIWGICGWGGRLTGVETTGKDGKTAYGDVLAPEPDIVHTATWAKKDNIQTLIVDGRLIFQGSPPVTFDPEPGYFCFDVYGAGSSLVIGSVTLSTYI